MFTITKEEDTAKINVVLLLNIVLKFWRSNVTEFVFGLFKKIDEGFKGSRSDIFRTQVDKSEPLISHMKDRITVNNASSIKKIEVNLSNKS